MSTQQTLPLSKQPSTKKLQSKLERMKENSSPISSLLFLEKFVIGMWVQKESDHFPDDQKLFIGKIKNLTANRIGIDTVIIDKLHVVAKSKVLGVETELFLEIGLEMVCKSNIPASRCTEQLANVICYAHKLLVDQTFAFALNDEDPTNYSDERLCSSNALLYDLFALYNKEMTKEFDICRKIKKLYPLLSVSTKESEEICKDESDDEPYDGEFEDSPISKEHFVCSHLYSVNKLSLTTEKKRSATTRPKGPSMVLVDDFMNMGINSQ